MLSRPRMPPSPIAIWARRTASGSYPSAATNDRSFTSGLSSWKPSSRHRIENSTSMTASVRRNCACLLGSVPRATAKCSIAAVSAARGVGELDEVSGSAVEHPSKSPVMPTGLSGVGRSRSVPGSRPSAKEFPSPKVSLHGARVRRHPRACFGQAEPSREVAICWLVGVATAALTQTDHGDVNRQSKPGTTFYLLTISGREALCGGVFRLSYV